MVRTPRRDAPGRIHHVFNRAARRQVLFADRRDYRKFLMLLACAVRRGELVVQAYCLMSTHFHLLVWSPEGRLSYAMMRVQNAYARYRNRRSRVDGPLFRGRFGSRPVLSWTYWLTLIRYLAHNPVEAGLSAHPFDHPYSSAAYFAAPSAPPWLDRAGVEDRLRRSGLAPASTRGFARLLRAPLAEGESALVQQRMRHPRAAEDALDELFRAPPTYVAQWMARKIATAGGRTPWSPMAAPRAVAAAVRSLEETLGPWSLCTGGRPHDGWAVLCAGLLQGLGGLTVDAIGHHMACHRATAARRVRWFRSLLADDAEFARRAGLAARGALDATFPS